MCLTHDEFSKSFSQSLRAYTKERKTDALTNIVSELNDSLSLTDSLFSRFGRALESATLHIYIARGTHYSSHCIMVMIWFYKKHKNFYLFFIKEWINTIRDKHRNETEKTSAGWYKTVGCVFIRLWLFDGAYRDTKLKQGHIKCKYKIGKNP